MMKISSKENPVIKYLVKLYSKKSTRDEGNAFIVEGYHLVQEAKNAGLLKQVYSIKEEKEYPDAIIITDDLLKKITDTINPEGIIAVVNKPNSSKTGDKVLYLDFLQDPGNIGTLMRSALAFNFDTIILDNTVDPFNPKVVRSSQGSIFNLSLVNKSLKELKEEGYQILSTSMNGSNINSIKLNEKVVLILGNEGQGVRKEYQDFADINLTIPMHKMESLNVGVAGSILMYEINK